MKFSIAIPTFNSSEYLLQCLSSLKNSKNINEIVISDDFSSEEEYSRIQEIKKQFLKKNDVNILLSRNNINLGGFKNKYVAISKCTNEFVYQLDSDNLAGLKLSKILNNNLVQFNPQTFYLPSKVYLFKKNPIMSIFLKKKYKVTLSKKDLEVTKLSITDAFKNDKRLFVDVKNNWVLNLGNFIVNRKTFLKTMKFAFESTNLPLAADPLAMSYYWLNMGGKLKLLENFYHFHRLRPNSYWHSAGIDAKLSVEYFEKQIKNL